MTAGLSSPPSLVVLAAAPRSAPLTKALAVAVEGATLSTDLAGAEEALLAQPAARLVVACPRPEISVADRLAQAMPPSNAVAEWLNEMRGLMALLRKNRRRSTLVFDHLAVVPADLASLLNLDAEVAPPEPFAPPDEVLLVIARDAILQDATASAFAGEIEATALSPADAGLDLAPDTVFATYRDSLARREQPLHDRIARSEAQTAMLRDEIALLRNQLVLGRDAEAKTARQLEEAKAAIQTAVQDGQSALRTETARWQEQSRLQEAERKAAADKLSAVGARENHLAEESALLRKQLEFEIEATTRANTIVTGLRRDHTKLQGDIQKLQAERDNQSTRADKVQQDGQRVIAQLRQQVFNLGQELELQHSRGEAHQVERQELLSEIRELHAIRAELESYFDHAQRLQEQVGVLSAQAGRLEGEVQAGQSALSERAAHAEWLAAEMQRIYKSRSYRLLTPLRKLRKRGTPTA